MVTVVGHVVGSRSRSRGGRWLAGWPAAVKKVAPVVKEVAPVVKKVAPIVKKVAPIVKKVAPLVKKVAPIVFTQGQE